MHFLLLLPALLLGGAALAQTAPPPAAGRPPVVLAPGQMRVQPHGPANRPDRPPVFPGGEAAMGEFFAQHVVLPARAQAARVRGNVLITATVGTDGQLTDPKVTQSLSPECDAEALRVVRLLPAWQPATRRGVPVPVLVQVPVPFNNAQVVEFEKDRRLPRSTKEAPGLN